MRHIFGKQDEGALDVLIFAAHPDDAEIGMGGTIAVMAARDYRVGIVDLTRGEMASRGTPDQRLEESRTAAEVLDVSLRVNVGLSDGFLTQSRESQSELLQLIRRHRPSMIFTHHPNDPHPDHTSAFHLVRWAAHNAGLGKMAPGLAPHRPKYLFTFIVPHRVRPSFIVDVSTFWDKKMQSIRCFHSQVSPTKPGDPETYLGDAKYFNALESHSRSLGNMVGVDFAEAFHSEMLLLIDDPIAAFQHKKGRFL